MEMFQIDEQLAKARYRRLSARYDHATRRIEPVRKSAINALRLRPGDRVLDVACGTGKSFDMLLEAVGPEGSVVGAEQSPEMLAQANRRVQEAGWTNVELIESKIELAQLPGPFDAVLFVYTHDVLQSDAALARIFSATYPGTRIACTGLKLFPWFLGVANVWLLATSYRYFTTFNGLARPWARLDHYVNLLNRQSTFMGSGYIVNGIRR